MRQRRNPSQLGVNGTRACNGRALQVKKKETSKSGLPPSHSGKKMFDAEDTGGAEVAEKAERSATFFFLTFLWLCGEPRRLYGVEDTSL